jgi:glucokinase
VLFRSGQRSEIEATPLAPKDDRESAIIATLDPNSYTAIVSGRNETSGIALAEIYDLGRAADSKLANISTRGLVQNGESVMIGGFMLGGSSGDGNVIIRALGPSLGSRGISNTLADPTLELRDANGTLLRANDNWQENASEAAEISATGIPPQNQLESTIIATLPPGDYTAIVGGKDDSSGVGLVEIYNAP